MGYHRYRRVILFFSFDAEHHPQFIPVGDIPFDSTKGDCIENVEYVTLGAFIVDLLASGYVLESANRQCRTGNWQPFEDGNVYIEEKAA